MKRILESFKNLYNDPEALKKHLLIAALFIIPGLLGAVAQFIDKENKEYLIPLIIAACILLCLSIFPMLFLSGYYLKFINRRLTEPVGLPVFDFDCFIKGLKAFPLYLVWGVYVSIPLLLYLSVVITGFIFIIASNPTSITAALALIALFIMMFLTVIPLFLVSPFITMVIVRYSENFEYSAELFNPITPFRYMKKAFKEIIIIALKFVVVNIAVSTATQMILMVLFLLIFLLVMFGVLITGSLDSTSQLPLGLLVLAIILSGFVGAIAGYANQITQLAYIDNLEDVYKEKFMEKPESISDKEIQQ